eukprot:CAMPEP_0171334174 /NCGR_PEP_ID=MMETSP0878-20121228/4500_1 /TAXON_ID=67004 /ORGANISM="Thalassiosira weissflogii, Strain CCMP1336" /LENGTH=177 /DNA_ID=CAMNT_0011835239 /DNA_START=27 /DNA_END=560 /DNA_ORIENTATION=-
MKKSISNIFLTLLSLTNPGEVLAFSSSPQTSTKTKSQSFSTTSTSPIILDRRHAVLATIAGTAASLLSSPIPAQAAPAGAEAFLGKFSDPINHPGGTRTIRLLDQKVGDYQLAEVVGGGGRGEPENFVLPAVVVGDRSIIIDFTPKGGPRDFVGVLDGKNGDIKFLRDGNRWPRLQE